MYIFSKISLNNFIKVFFDNIISLIIYSIISLRNSAIIIIISIIFSTFNFNIQHANIIYKTYIQDMISFFILICIKFIYKFNYPILKHICFRDSFCHLTRQLWTQITTPVKHSIFSSFFILLKRDLEMSRMYILYILYKFSQTISPTKNNLPHYLKYRFILYTSQFRTHYTHIFEISCS